MNIFNLVRKYLDVKLHSSYDSFTSWDSTGTLAGGARDAVPSCKLHIGELRYVPVLSILLTLTINVVAFCRQGFLTLVVVLGQM